MLEPDNNKTPESSKLAYSIAEASEATSICRTLIYKAMKKGELPFKKYGKRRLILHSALQDWLEAMPSCDPKHLVGALLALVSLKYLIQALFGPPSF